MEYSKEAMREVTKILQTHERDLLALAMNHAAERGAAQVEAGDVEWAHKELFL